MAEALRSHFSDVRLLDYRHWGQQDSQMDIEHEISQAVTLTEDFGEYVNDAKSIGTVIASLAIARGLLTPRGCLYMGFPLKVVEANLPETANALPTLPPTTFLHNEHDPLGSAEEVRVYVSAHAPRSYNLQVLSGNTHDYIDFNLIARVAASR